MAMKEGLKKQWVEALRSGKFKQGREQLKIKTDSVDEFCCLGVLCEISPKVKSLGHSNNVYLSQKALEYAGFGDDDQRKLANMNDGNDATHIKKRGFKAIATYIEKNL